MKRSALSIKVVTSIIIAFSHAKLCLSKEIGH
jgi:hypothetical protein